jgi:hypothetical protein
MARDHVIAQRLPVTALCSAELRIPEPLASNAFGAFNETYLKVLDELGLLIQGRSPLARTNVAPLVDAPSQPSLYAFGYVRPAPTGATLPSFVLAGQGDLANGLVVLPGDVSPGGLKTKTEAVLSGLGGALHKAGLSWSDARQAQLYTGHVLSADLVAEVLRGIGPAAAHGLTWHLSRPPVAGLEIEIDIRNVAAEIHLP